MEFWVYLGRCSFPCAKSAGSVAKIYSIMYIPICIALLVAYPEGSFSQDSLECPKNEEKATLVWKFDVERDLIV